MFLYTIFEIPLKYVISYSKIHTNKKIEQIIYLYAELENCEIMESKTQENLKMQITNLINSK